MLSNMIKLSSNFLTDLSKAVLFVDLFCYLCFVFVCHTVFSVPFIHVVTCWERNVLLYIMFSCVLSLSDMVYWSGVVFDCIDS